LPYFVDSNVIIGYIFYNADSWGRASIQAFDDKEENYSGDYVKRECFGDCNGDYESGKVNTIKNYVSKVLNRIILYLKEGKTIQMAISETEKEIKVNRERIDEIIDEVQKEKKANPHRSIQSLLTEKKRDFEKQVILRRAHVDKNCCWDTCQKPYTDIYNQLLQIIDDEDDIEVLIGAHHLAQSCQDLTFISGDYKDVIPNTLQILSITDINNIKPLRDFNN
jgi:hypothetical protein